MYTHGVHSFYFNFFSLALVFALILSVHVCVFFFVFLFLVLGREELQSAGVEIDRFVLS